MSNELSIQIRKNALLASIIKEFFIQYPKQFLFLLFLLILEGFSAAVSVLAFIPLADFLLNPLLPSPSFVTKFVLKTCILFNFSPNFWVFSTFFVGTQFIKNFIDVFIRYAILTVKYTVLGGLLDNALHSFFKARWGFFIDSDQGLLANTLNKELPIIGDTLGELTQLLAQIVKLGTYLAVPLWLNPVLTISAVGLAFLFSIPFLFLRHLSFTLGWKNTETGNILMGTLNELLSAARLILGFGQQTQARDRYLSDFAKHVKATLASQTLTTAIPKLFAPFGMLAAIIAMGIALRQNTPIPELGAVMWSLMTAVPILTSLVQGHISISNFLPSYQQLLNMRIKATNLQEVQGNKIFKELNHCIELKNVTFAYPDRLQTLIKINLKINKGQMVALVGESGSGKSTVVDLILGLQIPDYGEILIDGIPLGEWQQNTFRWRVGYVPQDTFLFHGSIKDNLRWASISSIDTELWDALHLANAATFVAELPDGIDTIVGDRGTRLSGGQRQRIALARAFLRKPDLLILDEATSALDSESERLIQNSIEKIAGDTTILVIAHRLSTIERSDQIYVMRNGQIVEGGTFVELCTNSNSILGGMVKLQLPT